MDPPLPDAADPDTQVDQAGRLAREVRAGLCGQPVRHRLRQHPCQHRQPGPAGRQDRRRRGRLVIGMAGDAGVVEHEQARGPGAGGHPGDVAGQILAGDRGQPAVRVIQ